MITTNFTQTFKDGIQSLSNMLLNTRNASNANAIVSEALDMNELNEIYKTGLGNRIVGLKVNTAFKEGFEIEETDQAKIDKLELMPVLRKACRFQLAFGRSIVVLVTKNVDLSEPLVGTVNVNTTHLKVFEGYEVSCETIDIDLMSERYMRPENYIVRGHRVHHTRVVDFRYILPIDVEAPAYNYGGISEFELIYNQLINDGVVERMTPLTVERGAVVYYKVKGFKQALQNGKEKDILKFYSAVERMKNVAGAVVTDSDDQIEVKNQAVSNLQDADKITLRRLAMVTGIPLKILMGESFMAQGLGANSRIEDDVFNSMITNLQHNHFLAPINELMEKLGLIEIPNFRAPEELGSVEKVKYEADVLRNAGDIERLGGDYVQYLKDKGFDEYVNDIVDDLDDDLDENLDGTPDDKKDDEDE